MLTPKNKNIFITGGAGFVGSHLVEHLISDSHVTVYDNFHRDALRYTALGKHPHLKIVKGDILDQNRLKGAVRGTQIIFHLAAVAGIENVIVSPLKTLEVIYAGK